MDIQRILFPTDFSKTSQRAAICACDLARNFGAELHILFVLEDAMGKLPATIFPAPGEEQFASSEALTELSDNLQADFSGIERLICATRQGPPSTEIVHYSDENDIDLIVVGTHARTGIGHMIMGSVAESVVRKAKCPVMTVRPDRE